MIYGTHRFAVSIALLIIAVIVISNVSGLRLLSDATLLAAESQVRQLTDDTTLERNEQRQKLAVLEASLKLVEDENKKLRSLLGFFESNDYEYIMSAVASRDPFNQSLLYISRGRNHGIQIGQAVVVADGIIVGKIRSVSKSRSTVELLINGASRIAVRVLSDESIPGIVRGSFGNALHLEFVVNEARLTSGDPVVTSGSDPLIPHGLVVGLLRNVSASPNELFISADVDLPLDYSDITTVAVLKTQ